MIEFSPGEREAERIYELLKGRPDGEENLRLQCPEPGAAPPDGRIVPPFLIVLRS